MTARLITTNGQVEARPADGGALVTIDGKTYRMSARVARDLKRRLREAPGQGPVQIQFDIGPDSRTLAAVVDVQVAS
jgi:hypothetical protein